MKLFAFVRRARQPAAAPVEAERAVVPMELDAAAAVAPAEKRRRRPSGSAAAAWKPTLGAISEDGAAVASSAASKAKAKPAAGKAKAKARAPPPRVAARADYDDFRHFGAPTVLPAFAPTAFLF